MKSFLLLFFSLSLATVSCTPSEPATPVDTCTLSTPINTRYAKADTLRALMNRYTAKGLPGISMAIYSAEDGYWTGASGFARIEDKTAMQPCHLLYSQSVAKTYMAVAVLKLADANRIQFDAPVTQYLPTITQYVPNAQTIAVRMLLNHTSGVYDYAVSPTYVAFLLQHPLQHLTTDELLAYTIGHPLAFKPGSKFAYSNTNYLLLALVVDQITGDHARYIRETVLKPVGLQQTFYHDHAAYLAQPNVVNSYIDRFGTGHLENVTRWQQTNVGNSFGDDGIVASALDYVQFLRSVLEGQQLSPESLKTMMTWVNGTDGKPTYGMGLYHSMLHGRLAYGHSGAGVGAGCSLHYFPEKQLYLFVGVNVGVLTGGPATKMAGEIQDELIDILLK